MQRISILLFILEIANSGIVDISSYPELLSGISAVEAGSTNNELSIKTDLIVFTTPITLNENIIIYGNGATFTSSGNRALFRLGSKQLEISNISIQETKRAFIVSGGDLYLHNVNASNNNGVINFNGNTLVIEDCDFASNTAPESGGVIIASGEDYESGWANITITNTTMSHNSAPQGGCIVVKYGHSCTILNSRFWSNEATESGGVLFAEDGATIQIFNSTFQTNTAVLKGGVLFLDEDSVAIIHSSSFTKNTASDHGGCLYIGESVLNVSDSTFDFNQAAGNGGAIYVELGRFFSSKCTFLENSASSKGGSLCILENTAPTYINGGNFSYNSAVYGGMLYTDTTAHFSALESNLTIEHNTASGQGGFSYIFTAEGDTITLFGDLNALLRKNTASEGSGIFVASGTEARIHNFIFEQHQASETGTIYCGTSSTAFIDHVYSRECIATDYGSLVYISASATARVVNSESYGDTANAIIYAASNSYLYLTDVRIQNATMSDASGAIYARNAHVLSIHNSQIISNYAVTGSSVALSVTRTSNAQSVLTVYNTTFLQNTNANGRIIFVNLLSDGATFIDCTVSGNTAGGGYSSMKFAESYTYWNNSNLTSNTATGGDGGALMIEKGVLVLNDCALINNTARSSTGGALIGTQGAQINVYKASFQANRALSGGAVSLEGASLRSFGHCSWHNNIASYDAGAILMTGGSTVNFDLENDDLFRNQARFGGGGCIWVDADTESPQLPSNVRNNFGTYGNNIASAVEAIQVRHDPSTEEMSGYSPLLAPVVVVVLDRFDQVVNTTETIVVISAEPSDVALSGEALTMEMTFGKVESYDMEITYTPGSIVTLHAAAEIDGRDYFDSTNVTLRNCQNNEQTDGETCYTCGEGSYMAESGACVSCKNGMICLNGATTTSIRTSFGYYRTTADSSRVYKCRYSAACPGNGTSENTTQDGITYGVKLADGVYGSDICADGYEGLLCAQCSKSYYTSGQNICSECTSGLKWATIAAYTFIFTFLVMFIGFICFTSHGQDLFLFWFEAQSGAASDVVEYLQHDELLKKKKASKDQSEDLDAVSCASSAVVKYKVLVSFLQIIAAFPFAFGHKVSWPSVYEKIWRYLGSIVNLSLSKVLPTECITRVSSNTYFVRTLVGVTLTPIFLCITLWVCNVILKPDKRSEASFLQQRNRSFQMCLMFLHLALPLCSRTPVMAIVCDFFDEGAKGEVGYVRSNLTMSCSSATWKYFVFPYSLLFIIIYPIGIPLVYTVLLYKSRHILNPTLRGMNNHKYLDPDSQQYQRALIAKRDELAAELAQTKGIAVWNNVKAFRFAWNDYEPRCFWYEAYDTYRRIFYTAVLAAVVPGSTLQILIGFCISIFGFSLYGRFRPFIHPDDDIIAETAAWSILVTLLVALLIRGKLVLNGPVGEQLALVLLCIAAIGPLCAFLWVFRKTFIKTSYSFTTFTLLSPNSSRKVSPLAFFPEGDKALNDSSDEAPAQPVSNAQSEVTELSTLDSPVSPATTLSPGSPSTMPTHDSARSDLTTPPIFMMR